jgi:2-polyprenyl-3-methyl-5-hydroxy-6-metoxy-1,4-benzoquinol methylase
VGTPAGWLIDNRDLWPRQGPVLDVACGEGRTAVVMAQSGLQVRAIDRHAGAIAILERDAARLRLPVETAVVDLETEPVPGLGDSLFEAVVVFNYLHRPLMPALRAAVKPGGRIFYETFTTRQAERGKPSNPAFLLKAGELQELMQPFIILRSREGDFEGRFIASIVAQRPLQPQFPGPQKAQMTL